MDKKYKENVLERMERTGAKEQMAAFMERQKWDYEAKKAWAASKVREFYWECYKRKLNMHVSVGGLDSITLFLFIKSLGYNVPGVSASTLEDRSIQLVHKALGIENVMPLKDKDGRTYTKARVIQEFGFPVLSKEIAGKIELLQNPSEKNATVRHAIITGETGEYGGNRKNTRMKMSQKWLEKFGGYENEREGTNYGVPDFKVSAKCCYYLKEKPCDDWAKAHHSVPFLGIMASEGGRREKSLKLHGCNYFGESTIRSAPFAIFMRDDILTLADEMDAYYRREIYKPGCGMPESSIPTIYGTIEMREDGSLYTTGAQRTGCSLCGFGIHLEKRPNRFDLLYERNPKEWEYLMFHLCKDADGNDYGWAHVLDYIGVGWEPDEQLEITTLAEEG